MRALISVYDKEGIVEFARELEKLGWEIVSTGGTYKTLKAADIKVIEVDEVTKFPEILDGRVKTLNPFIHGGLLYKRDDETHKNVIDDMGIKAIDMVVNNLYPFEETIKKSGVSHEEIIENIDIGGPSMIRAGAKNYKSVTVIMDPKDYNKVLGELKENGDTNLQTKKYLAGKVFNYTAYYDSLIGKYFNKETDTLFPDTLTLSFKNMKETRYGENPHQRGAFYEEVIDTQGTLSQGKQIHGKELSFNNINDSNGALKVLKEFDEPTVVGVKHSNPSGIGSDENLLNAYKKMYECDSESIFGGIIASNREIDKDVAEEINKIFIEVVLAPSFSKEAIEVLTLKKNIRLIEIENIDKRDYGEMDIKKVLGGLLIQERDFELFKDDLEVVTDRFPADEELEDMYFAWKAVKNINSNGVVLVKDKATIGFGLGSVNRFWAVERAIETAGENIKNSTLASDGFFPFKDSMELLGKNKISAVIQPGGSIKDGEVIEEANRQGMTMVFTGIRHFKH